MSVNGFTFGDDPTIQKYNYESLDNIPDIENGTYPNMAVGSLIGENKVTDKEPYFLRPSASIGDREYDTLVGGTVGWNQLAKRDSSSSGSATINSSTDSSINATFTQASGQWGVAYFTGSNIPFIVGHKYLLLGDLQLASAFTGNFYVVLGGTQSQADHFFRADTSKTTVQKVDTVVNCVTAMATATIFAQSNTSGITFDLSNVMAIDLTTLFGSTIADYIYSLETAHAGDGVAWVRRYLPNDYYAYCAPTLKHVSGVSAHVMRDANNNVIGNYPIDSTWVGMGVPKLDSSNKLYFDGDTYASDGTVTVKYGIVDLGTLDWNYFTPWGFQSTTAVSNILSPTSDNNIANVFSAQYQADSCNAIFAQALDKTIGIRGNNGRVCIRDTSKASMTTAEFKASLDGTYLVYELATPTTSSASPFTSPQICDPNGTEEYVSDSIVPVGHATQYPENLADKIASLPPLPTTAGTYRLKVTVTAGKASYTWVSA